VTPQTGALQVPEPTPFANQKAANRRKLRIGKVWQKYTPSDCYFFNNGQVLKPELIHLRGRQFAGRLCATQMPPRSLDFFQHGTYFLGKGIH
jgi:hypothetical protein